MGIRNFSSSALATALTAAVPDAVAVTCAVEALDGYPPVPFEAVLDPETPAEEVLLVTGVAGAGPVTVTVQRGFAGTTAVTHAAGAVFEHRFSSVDLAEANAHVNDASLHGGGGGGDAHYTHEQLAPSTAWHVVHNLGRYPAAVAVLTSAGTQFYGDVTHLSVSELVVGFTHPFAGTVEL